MNNTDENSELEHSKDPWYTDIKRVNQQEISNPMLAVKNILENEAFKAFIEALTERDPIKVVCLRSIIQRILFSAQEGTEYQCGFWLYGKPGTSKSIWLEIAKLVSENSIMEIAHNNNQFTASTIEGKKLLILSDFEKITPSKKWLIH